MKSLNYNTHKDAYGLHRVLIRLLFSLRKGIRTSNTNAIFKFRLESLFIDYSVENVFKYVLPIFTNVTYTNRAS